MKALIPLIALGACATPDALLMQMIDPMPAEYSARASVDRIDGAEHLICEYPDGASLSAPVTRAPMPGGCAAVTGSLSAAAIIALECVYIDNREVRPDGLRPIKVVLGYGPDPAAAWHACGHVRQFAEGEPSTLANHWGMKRRSK